MKKIYFKCNKKSGSHLASTGLKADGVSPSRSTNLQIITHNTPVSYFKAISRRQGNDQANSQPTIN
jgi:hypothetical protein